ncbi:MAG TPA: hypothetical protein VL172_09115 [Kofleriaceae bacterium]|nr:hypothetical protein [Kofleriaceae bacterium]
MNHPRIALLSGLALATGLAAPAAAQQPPGPPPAGGVCVVVDLSRDTLSEPDRNAARSLLLQAFENEHQPVDATGGACTETYVLSNIKLGNTINVSINGPRGQRGGRASTEDDLPIVYAQMVKSLLTGEPMATGSGTVDRNNVTRDQTAPRRVAADSLKYVELGYGGVIAGRFAAGPAFGFGWRKELDRIGIDVAITFVLANDFDSDAGNVAIPRLAAVWYQQPIADSTPYYGIGLSYGFTGATNSTGDYAGSGLQLHAIAGYEMFRSSTIRGFFQIDGIAPVYQSDIGGGSGSKWTPTISAAVGLGWGHSNTVRVVND